MFKGPPLKKLSKNNKAVIMYLLFIVASFIAVQVFSYSSKPTHLDLFLDCTYFMKDQLMYITNLIFAISIITFFVSWCKDPGYIKTDPTIDFMEIIEQFDPNLESPFLSG